MFKVGKFELFLGLLVKKYFFGPRGDSKDNYDHIIFSNLELSSLFSSLSI